MPAATPPHNGGSRRTDLRGNDELAAKNRTRLDVSGHARARLLIRGFCRIRGARVLTGSDPGMARVQEAASHADPRTTMRNDRAQASLDRHAAYIVAAYVAGAAR
jgi:hypothetical protein